MQWFVKCCRGQGWDLRIGDGELFDQSEGMFRSWDAGRPVVADRDTWRADNARDRHYPPGPFVVTWKTPAGEENGAKKAYYGYHISFDTEAEANAAAVTIRLLTAANQGVQS